MDERDYKTYISVFNNMSNFMRKPNVIVSNIYCLHSKSFYFIQVHLDVTPEESMKRIQLRGREMEKNISMDYLKKLYEYYNDFLQEISKVIPVIKVNWNEYQDVEEMASIIKKEMEEIQNIRTVTFNK